MHINTYIGDRSIDVYVATKKIQTLSIIHVHTLYLTISLSNNPIFTIPLNNLS